MDDPKPPATNGHGPATSRVGVELENLGPPEGTGTTSPKMLVPLFLVPLLIVAVIVGIFLGVGWLVGHEEPLGDLISRVETGGVNDRWQAAAKLTEVARRDPAQLADPHVRERLREVFKVAGPDDSRLRRFLASLWGTIGDAESAPVIADGVQRLKELLAQPGARDSAISEHVTEELIDYLLSLGTLGGSLAETAILSVAADPDPGIRMTVAAALGGVEHKSVAGGADPSVVLVAALTKLHDDADVWVRMNAALSLAKVGRVEGLPTLELMLDRAWLKGQNLHFPDDGRVTVTNHDPAAVLMVSALLAIDRLVDAEARGTVKVRSAALKELATRATQDPHPDVKARAEALLEKLGT